MLKLVTSVGALAMAALGLLQVGRALRARPETAPADAGVRLGNIDVRGWPGVLWGVLWLVAGGGVLLSLWRH
jgi:hypothetical protein